MNFWKKKVDQSKFLRFFSWCPYLFALKCISKFGNHQVIFRQKQISQIIHLGPQRDWNRDFSKLTKLVYERWTLVSWYRKRGLMYDPHNSTHCFKENFLWDHSHDHFAELLINSFLVIIFNVLRQDMTQCQFLSRV